MQAMRTSGLLCKSTLALWLNDFQMNCLRRICGISLLDQVPNVEILTRCNTLSVKSQLQSKRVGWLGYLFMMPDDRLPKKMLFGQVKGHRLPLLPQVYTCTLQGCSEQIALEGQDLPRTYLAHHELESVL